MPIQLPEEVPGVFLYKTGRPPTPNDPPTTYDICRAVDFETDVVHRFSEYIASRSIDENEADVIYRTEGRELTRQQNLNPLCCIVPETHSGSRRTFPTASATEIEYMRS